MASAARAWLGWWILLALLWVALADSRRLEEIVAAVAVGALGATASLLVRHEREFLVRPRPRALVRALAPALRWPRDLVLLARALASRPAGEVVEEPFDGDDPTRRALAVGGGSLAPNSIVIGIDDERGVIVSHRLVDEGDGR
jgi:multisubunit Na+/H+ antiporter MnhE subunit